MAVTEASATRRAGTIPSGLVVGLLAALVVLVGLVAFNTHRLVIEQQRSTCFARLAWLTPGDEERPGGVERATAARLCEGNSPVTEFQDGD